MNVVDLGGQDEYFATHPFFFSKRAVYLLCWSERIADPPHTMKHYIDTIRAAAPDARAGKG